MTFYEQTKQEILDAKKYGDLHTALRYEDEIREFIKGALKAENMESSFPIVASLLNGLFFAHVGHTEELYSVLDTLARTVSPRAFRAYVSLSDVTFEKLKNAYMHKVTIPQMRCTIALIEAKTKDERLV
jgi:hypothetical protein